MHIIIGAEDYTKIKVQDRPRIGLLGQPARELNKQGWVVISPGQENIVTSMLYSKAIAHDYKKFLYFGCPWHWGKSQEREGCGIWRISKEVAAEWYETDSFWKDSHTYLSSNKSGSLGRLNTLIRRMNSVWRPPKSNQSNISLSDCLEIGPAQWNLLWDTLIRTKSQPILFYEDVQKTFLQIQIKEAERNSLRFHWVEILKSNKIRFLEFTRLVFGLTESPLILEETLNNHFENYWLEFEETVKQIEKNMYLDDLVTGRNTLDEVRNVKIESAKLFQQGSFILLKGTSTDI